MAAGWVSDQRIARSHPLPEQVRVGRTSATTRTPKKNQPTASQQWAVSYQHLISGSNLVKILTTKISRL